MGIHKTDDLTFSWVPNQDISRTRDLDSRSMDDSDFSRWCPYFTMMIVKKMMMKKMVVTNTCGVFFKCITIFNPRTTQ